MTKMLCLAACAAALQLAAPGHAAIAVAVSPGAAAPWVASGNQSEAHARKTALADCARASEGGPSSCAIAVSATGPVYVALVEGTGAHGTGPSPEGAIEAALQACRKVRDDCDRARVRLWRDPGQFKHWE